jgi:hypothetical protein
MRGNPSLVAAALSGALLLAGCAAPGVPPSSSLTGSGIEGKVWLGPTCPVERNPPDPNCADRPFATRLALTTADGARVVTEFDSGEDGAFHVRAEPGDYVIRGAREGGGPPTCASEGAITVVAERFTMADVQCDSGIR